LWSVEKILQMSSLLLASSLLALSLPSLFYWCCCSP
jgi:hypothetical protein